MIGNHDTDPAEFQYSAGCIVALLFSVLFWVGLILAIVRLLQ